MTAAKTSTPTAIWCGCIDSDASLIQFQDFMDGKLRLERWRRALINGGEIMRGAEQTPGVRGCAPLLAQVDGDDLVGSIRGRFRQSCWSILAVARKDFGRGRPRRQQGAGRPRRVLRGRVACGKIAGVQAGPEDQEHTGSSRSRSLRLPDAAAHDSYSVAQEALALQAVCVIRLAGQFPAALLPGFLPIRDTAKCMTPNRSAAGTDRHPQRRPISAPNTGNGGSLSYFGGPTQQVDQVGYGPFRQAGTSENPVWGIVVSWMKYTV